MSAVMPACSALHPALRDSVAFISGWKFSALNGLCVIQRVCDYNAVTTTPVVCKATSTNVSCAFIRLCFCRMCSLVGLFVQAVTELLSQLLAESSAPLISSFKCLISVFLTSSWTHCLLFANHLHLLGIKRLARSTLILLSDSIAVAPAGFDVPLACVVVMGLGLFCEVKIAPNGNGLFTPWGFSQDWISIGVYLLFI